MDYYDYNRARAVINYSQIDCIEQEIELLSEKIHRIRTTNLLCELKANENIRLKKQNLIALLNQKDEFIDIIKILASKVIISNLKIYTAKNQSINNVIFDNKIFRNKKKIKNNVKLNKLINKYYDITKLNPDIIFLKTEVNKLIPKFFKKWDNFKNNKFPIILKKENDNIKILETKINSKNNLLEKKINRIKFLETSIFKSKEYLKLNTKREINKNTFWDIEIKSAVRKYTHVKNSYASVMKLIEIEYGNIFKNNKTIEMCPICLEEDNRYIKTSCGHYFHVECICVHIHRLLTSVNIEIKCPMCRQIMV